MIDSLRLTTCQKVATPADWQQGDEVKKLFPAGVTTHRTYLRTTAQLKAD